MLTQPLAICRDQPGDAPRPVRENPPVADKSAPPLVLVVDDERLVRWSITETLRGAGYRVEEAPDARTAIASVLFDGPPPDAVLLDLKLPDSADLRLLESLHQFAPDMPIVLMTAFGTPELSAEARRSGACAVLNKPFDLARLEVVLAAALEPGRGSR